MLLGKRVQIPIIPGVNPTSDSTELDTIFFTAADKVRFQEGKLRKLKGWQRIYPVNNINITGVCRNIFSYRDANNNPIELFGTSFGLFAYFPKNGDYFYNITPLSTDTVNIPSAFTTEYNASAVVEIRTTAGSTKVSLSINNYFEDDDLITISSVSGGPYNGIPASAFNGNFPVFVINNGLITINVSAPATFTGITTVPMTWASGYLYVSYPSHGITLGERIGILLADDVDGITAADINKEFIVSNIKDTNNFIIQTKVPATSLVTGGGGGSTTLQVQIASGLDTGSAGFGYGSGKYGAGIYGAGDSSENTNVIYPRIWSMDNFGTYVILTPGDPATTSTDNLYYWQGDINIAPTLVSASVSASNVPLACKWVYVSNNIVCVLGAAGVLNQFTSSDSGIFNNFTPGPATDAFGLVFQQASALLTQSKARGFDLIFTQSEVYKGSFVGKPLLWVFTKLFGTDGIIGPKARAVVEDAVFWMGSGDFYVFDGYTVNILPNNTVKRYVYDNLNEEQGYKCFAYANVEYSEVSFYYPSGNDTDPNNYVTYNYKEFHWTTGTMSRTASEERTNALGNPILVQSNNFITADVPNSIGTYFFTLETDPLATTMSSTSIVMSIQPTIYLQIGDIIFISGAVDTNGITAAHINGERTITAVSNNVGYGSGEYGAGEYGSEVVGITFTAGGAASSTGAGGGSGITVGTAIVSITYSGISLLSVNEIITVSGSTDVDGFDAGDLSITNPIRYIDGNRIEVDINTEHKFSTSSVIGGGGVGTNITFPDFCRVFKHDKGLNDYNNNFNLYNDPIDDQYAPMLSYAQTNYAQIQDGDNTMLIYSLYPDINQQQNMTVTINVKEYAQSPYIHTQVFTTTPNTTKIDPMMIGRVRQYTFTSNVLGGDYLIGKMYEEVVPSTPR